MRNRHRIGALLAAACCAGPCAAQSLVKDLAWAYAITEGPATSAPKDDGTLFTLPGSDKSFTLDQIRNRMGPADWYPGDHPPMPPIVAKGREEAGIWACGLCHYPNGKGRPENAGVSGLPKGYFIQQLEDMQNGLRHSAEPRKANTELMVGFAHQMTRAEMEQAAEYFGAQKWTRWIEVVETDTAPKTRVDGGMHLKLEGAEAGTEPLGRRIVESPKSAKDTELLRNPHSSFVAYVPKGSIAAGEALAKGGGGKVTPCAVCHGETYDGLALVPTLRGRSPSYIARQLVDFKQGTRHGVWAPLMAPVAAKLSADDILSLSAYLASLPPTQ